MVPNIEMCFALLHPQVLGAKHVSNPEFNRFIPRFIVLLLQVLQTMQDVRHSCRAVDQKSRRTVIRPGHVPARRVHVLRVRQRDQECQPGLQQILLVHTSQLIRSLYFSKCAENWDLRCAVYPSPSGAG